MDGDGKVKDEFTLKPNSQANRKMGLVSSPDTKHYLFHDLYTHVTMAPIRMDDEPQQAGEAHSEADDDKNYDAPVPHQIVIGDTIRFREGYMVFTGLNKNAKVENIVLGKNDIAVGAQLKIFANGKTYNAEPVFMIKDGQGLRFRAESG